MNKLFTTAAIIAAFIICPMTSAGVNGSVGVVISTSLGDINLELDKYCYFKIF